MSLGWPGPSRTELSRVPWSTCPLAVKFYDATFPFGCLPACTFYVLCNKCANIAACRLRHDCLRLPHATCHRLLPVHQLKMLPYKCGHNLIVLSAASVADLLFMAPCPPQLPRSSCCSVAQIFPLANYSLNLASTCNLQLLQLLQLA